MAIPQPAAAAMPAWPLRALAKLGMLCSLGMRQSSEVSAQPVYLLRLAVVGAASAVLLGRSVAHLSASNAIALAALAFLLVPRLALIKEQRRLGARFSEMLPDVIDMVVRILRAGLPVEIAIRTVGREVEPPVGTTFAAIADQTEIGVPLEEALAKTSDLVSDPDFRFFAVAVALQQSTGGNLAATLETLSGVIRKRRAARLKVRATIAEVRISAIVLGAIPFVVAGALLMAAPAYLLPLFNDRRGNIILGLALFCLLAAALIMRAMIRNVELVSPVRRRAGGKRAASGLAGRARPRAMRRAADGPELTQPEAALGIPADLSPRLLAALELLAGCGFAGVLALWSLSGGRAPIEVIAAAVLGMALGWSIPQAISGRFRRHRQRLIAQALPDAIELLVVAVEAGLSLEDAINRIAVELWRLQPAMAGELTLTAADLTILPDRDDAFRRFYERVKLPGVHSLTAALSQSLRYGMPLAQELRVAASELRNNMLLELEEQANRLPVLLTIPMIALIIPTLYLIICGPAFLIVLDALAR